MRAGRMLSGTQIDQSETAVVDLRLYAQSLRAHWWLVLLCCVVGGAVAAGAAASAPPQYRATIKLVSAGTVDPAGGASPITAMQRLKSYEALLAGPRLASSVIERTGVDIDPAELLSKVRATAVPETVVLTVSVDDADPLQARDIATAIGVEFPRLLGTLGGPVGGGRTQDTVTVFEPALLPTHPHSPRPARMGIGGAALGLVVGLVVVAARSRRTAPRPPATAQSTQYRPQKVR